MVGQKFKKCSKSLKIDMKTGKFVNILSWCTKKKFGLITDKINLSRKRGPKAMSCENFCKVTSRFC